MKNFILDGNSINLRVDTSFDANQLAFQVKCGENTYFRLESDKNGIRYKITNDTGVNWVTVWSK